MRNTLSAKINKSESGIVNLDSVINRVHIGFVIKNEVQSWFISLFTEIYACLELAHLRFGGEKLSII